MAHLNFAVEGGTHRHKYFHRTDASSLKENTDELKTLKYTSAAAYKYVVELRALELQWRGYGWGFCVKEKGGVYDG